MTKKELTSIEIHFLAKELQKLINAKIDQIYQPNKNELLFQLHLIGTGKKLLRIILPGFIFLTSEKPEMPKQITQFTETLREFMNNSRIREIKQIKNERIIEITIEKEKKYSLFIELFSKGNIILVYDEIILAVLKTQKWKNRIIQKGKKYNIPINKYDILDEKSFTKAIKNSEETISKTLAVKLGLGKRYAEELCFRAGINPLDKKINYEEIEKLYQKLKKILNEKSNPFIVYEDDQIIDIIPIELKKYSKKKFKQFKTYNEALSSILDKQALTQRKQKALQEYTQKLNKINTKIEKQKQTLTKMEKESIENQKKGEYIYEHYQEIKNKIVKAGGHRKIKLDIK